MIPKCARPHPLAGARPLSESGVGTTDGQTIAERTGHLNAAKPLPAELLELAEQIADSFVIRKRGGAQP